MTSSRCLRRSNWATDVALGLVPSLRSKVVFVPTGFSGLFDPTYARYFEQMPGWLRSADVNVFLSDDYRDVEFARRHGVTNYRIIPNGASEEEFGTRSAVDVRARLGIPRSDTLVLHVGSFTGIKGQREAIEVFRRARLQHATLLLVGDPSNRKVFARCTRRAWAYRANPLRLLDRNSVRVETLDRRTTVAAFQAADLFLFPSRIECSPIVLFEAVAAGTPFLSTDVGNAAEIARWTRGGVIMPTRSENGYSVVEPNAAAHQLRLLLADSSARREMAVAGQRSWRERFTWEEIAGQYERLYRELQAGRTT